jgi:hypothetical protein
MPKVAKRKALPESSEGEDFGNDDFSDDKFDSDESEIIPEDPWKPIIVSEGTTRSDYMKVNISLLKNE